MGQGPHRFKYKVGDWIQSNGHGTFWKITKRVLLSCVLPWPHDNYYRQPSYDVAFHGPAGRKMTERGLGHCGDQSGVLEKYIRPLTDPQDILWCLASDIKAKHYELAQQVKKLGEDFDATMRTRELLDAKD